MNKLPDIHGPAGKPVPAPPPESPMIVSRQVISTPNAPIEITRLTFSDSAKHDLSISVPNLGNLKR